MSGSIIWLLLNLDTEELCKASLTVQPQVTDIPLSWLMLTVRSFNLVNEIFFQMQNIHHFFQKKKFNYSFILTFKPRLFFASWDPSLYPECNHSTSSVLLAHECLQCLPLNIFSCYNYLSLTEYYKLYNHTMKEILLCPFYKCQKQP